MDNFSFSDNTIKIRDWHKYHHDRENNEASPMILLLSADSPIEYLTGPLDNFDRIVVTSIDFNDGRIFSLGRQIRLLGYGGILTIVGDILPDQYPALRSCGFDNALIPGNFSAGENLKLSQAHSLADVEDFASGNFTGKN